jgi:NHL repeat
MNPRRLAAALLAAAALAALPAPAQAAPRTIAEWGHGAGRVGNPYGTAVDRSSGDLYVADNANFRVDKFDSEGDFLLAWGYGVADGKSEVLQVCGPAASPPTKRCFATNFSPQNGGNPDNNLRASSVAVDQADGDVYVGDQYRVSKFTPSGQLIFMVGRDVNLTKREEAGTTQAERDFCAAASGDTCRTGDSGTGPNEFSGTVQPLAVDSSGTVWVGDKNRLVSFGPGGVPGGEIELPGAGNTTSLALDSSGDFYVKSDSPVGIRKLEAGTGALLETIDAAGHPRTVTLGEADNVYVGDSTDPYRFKVYDPAGEQVSQFGAGQVIGTPGGGGSASGSNAIAVGDAAGELYAASSRSAEAESAVQAFPLPKPGPLVDDQRAGGLLPSAATLTASLNPEGHETTYHFEYDTSPYGEGEAGHGTEVPLPEATLPGGEYEEEEVQASLEGLVPDTAYHFRLCASNSAGSVCGPDTAFATPTAVGIEAQWASKVAAHSASLNAELDPLGAKAEWWVEYDTSPYGEDEAGHGQSSPVSTLPAGFGTVPVGAPLSGLAPATSYHYRFVARDMRGEVEYTTYGEDRAFATQPAGLGFALPDGRAWEMVSPPDKHGGRIVAPDGDQGGQVQASANGDALAYLSLGSLEANPEGNRLIEQSSELARRAPGGVWSSADITPPHTGVTPYAAGSGLEYKLFSANLGRALLEPRDATPLSSYASERTPYLRENASPPTYAPLLVGCPPEGEPCPPEVEAHADVPAGTEFGGEATSSNSAVAVRGASPDLGQVVLRPVAQAIGKPVPQLFPGDSPGSLYKALLTFPWVT